MFISNTQKLFIRSFPIRQERRILAGCPIKQTVKRKY